MPVAARARRRERDESDHRGPAPRGRRSSRAAGREPVSGSRLPRGRPDGLGPRARARPDPRARRRYGSRRAAGDRAADRRRDRRDAPDGPLEPARPAPREPGPPSSSSGPFPAWGPRSPDGFTTRCTWTRWRPSRSPATTGAWPRCPGSARGRAAGLRAALGAMLGRTRLRPREPAEEPPVAMLLDVDRQYRDAAAAGPPAPDRAAPLQPGGSRLAAGPPRRARSLAVHGAVLQYRPGARARKDAGLGRRLLPHRHPIGGAAHDGDGDVGSAGRTAGGPRSRERVSGRLRDAGEQPGHTEREQRQQEEGAEDPAEGPERRPADIAGSRSRSAPARWHRASARP